MKIPRIFLFAGLGAALMYLFDPTNGEHRRMQLRDQMITLKDEVEGRAPMLADTARNLAAEARSMAEKLETSPTLDSPKTSSTTTRRRSTSSEG